jgi:hypothetical protein
MIAYMKVMRANSAPMLKRAGSDTTNANSSFLIPFAACIKKHKACHPDAAKSTSIITNIQLIFSFSKYMHFVFTPYIHFTQ